MKDFDIHLNATKGALEELHKDLVAKSNIKDICSLLDNKASMFLSIKLNVLNIFNKISRMLIKL